MISQAKPYQDFTIGVVGGGSWGTALADLLACKGYQIDLWVYEEEVKKQIKEEHENKVFLPGFKLSENLIPSNNMETVVAGKDLVLIVVPSHVMRIAAQQMSNFLSPETVLVSASKGIENVTHLSMTGVLQEVLPQLPRKALAVLSGPSFAKEVAGKIPTAIAVAVEDKELGQKIQGIFATPYFRVYTSDDILGVELGGAVKNVVAIAAGIVDGLELGLNTRAALITRGMTEIRRLGVHLGANPRTFTGLAGIGDLILTCTGDLSRNHTVGKKIGQGRKLKTILSEMRMVAEGVKTAKSVYNLSRKEKVEMPIAHGVYHILYDELNPKDVLHQLMTRDLKQELDDH
ncbi:MAG: NAD(P)H-dependent glycerol-3-phosphate dehydrogenase [Desulfobacterales bacterium]|nr:NAD(P)H-dependent glycerol-3-phosphate dehydrogenase [Desulfobacterales bacterium]